MIKFLQKGWSTFLISLLTIFLSTQLAWAANLTEVTVSPDSNTPGVSTNHTITFRTSASGAIATGGMIKVTYPAGFNVTNAILGGYSGNLGNPTLTKLVDTVFLTLDSSSNVGNSSLISFQLQTVINSSTSGNYTVTVETRNSSGQTIDGPTSSQQFTIGQVQTLDHFRVLPSTTTTTVAQDLTLTITAQDAGNATVTNYNGTPTLSGLATSPNNTAPYYGPVSFTNGVASVTVRSYSSQANQSVTVTDSGKTGNSGVINFSAGILNSLNITPSSNQTITAGQTIQFTAVGYDSYGNQRSGDTLTWTGTNSSGLFNNTTAGTYTVRASSGSINSSSVSVTVNPGALASLSISPSSSQSIKAGQTIQFTAASYDSYGNQRSGDTLTWTGTNSSGLFNNTTAGTYTVKASSGNISSASVTVTVSHSDTVDHLAISPTNLHLANADQTQTYTVSVYDQYGNPWDVSSQATFSATDPKGSFSANTYRAGKIGTWQIKASYSGKDVITNVTIDGPGVAAKVEFTNALSQLQINTIHQFTIKVFDADDNEISNPSLSWSIEQGQENAVLDQSGRFSANKTGTYKIKAKAGNAATVLTFEVVESKKTADSQKSGDQPAASQPTSSPTQPSQTETKTEQKSAAESSATTTPPKTTPSNEEETVIAVDDSQGQIKAAEVTTIGPEEEAAKGKISTTWISIISILIALAILGLAYWGYTVWANPLTETPKTDLVKKTKKETKEERKEERPEIPAPDKEQTDDQTRW